MKKTSSLIKGVVLGSIGFSSVFLVSKAHSTARTPDMLAINSSLAAHACTTETDAQDDELYFISCGGIY